MTTTSITNPKQSNLPRIGQIEFSNCLPINLPIERGRVELKGDFVSRVPNQLNQMIMAGQLDVSAVSLYCYLNCNNLELVPNLSVSSLGPVGSVLFFYKGELADLRNKPILVPNSSATSINLLSIILDQEAGIKPEYRRVDQPDITNDIAAGALVIGDRALKVDPLWSKDHHRIDLGKWWYDRYNLPMVFGVWAARKDWISENGEDYQIVWQTLNKAKEIGLSEMLDEVVNEAAKIMLLENNRVRKYFLEELDYNLKEEHQDSIKLYKDLCKQLNLL